MRPAPGFGPGDGPVAKEYAASAWVLGKHSKPLFDEVRVDQIVIVEKQQVVAADSVEPSVAGGGCAAWSLSANHLDGRGKRRQCR